MTAADRATIDAEVCVVGAGILGLAHAFEARRRGLRVVVLERDSRAVGASVRNFGHVFAAAMADGEALECAMTARQRWLELGSAAGLFIKRGGTLVVARAEDELAVLEAAVRNQARGARMLTGPQVGEIVPIPTEPLVGAMHSELDLRVDPRSAVAGLAALLEQDNEARVIFGAPVLAIEPGIVRAASVTVRAPAIVVCPGPQYPDLPEGLREGLQGLTRCRLQMLRIAAPGGRRYEPALATGLSLVRYPAFASQPAAAALRERLTAERPELLEAGIHLLVTQLPDGDLIIGDTHDYSETVSPFRSEELDALLLAEACSLLGADALEVRERWQGIYPSAPEGNYVATAPQPGVRVVEVVSGLGMTLSLGIAPRVLDELLGDGLTTAATGRPPLAAASRGSGA